MGTLLLGVDGGNTKTVALVAEPDGSVVGSGRGGCADIHNTTSPELAIVEIVRASSAALESAGARAEDLGAAVFSLAGADWPEDFELLRQELGGRLGLGDAFEIVNDAVGALRCGTSDSVGVAAVVGTFGAIAARNADGDLFHLGFWPDSTGAFALGDDALAAIWRHMLELGPATSLTGRALARWGCSDAHDLLHAFTRVGGLGESERASFANVVLDEAEAGDAVARRIVDVVGGRLGDYARVCAARTGQLGAAFPFVLCGGVLRHPSQHLRAAVTARVPDGEPIYPAVDPVVGAVLLAADRVGARPDPMRLRAGASDAAAPVTVAAPFGEGIA
jgi:N-acetylglucosamine kinase-like BadF-type ATPase